MHRRHRRAAVATVALAFVARAPRSSCLSASSSSAVRSTARVGGNGADARDKKKHVVVVGGGVGGLALASRIASSSSQSPTSTTSAVKVTLLEKNPESMLGGRCGSTHVEVENVVGTFRHERGPSLLLLKSVYEDLFADCGTNTAADYGLIMDQCVPAYQVVFDDGDCISVGFPRRHSTDDEDDGAVSFGPAEAAARAKMDSYEPNGAAKWDEYMTACAAFLDCGLPNFIEERVELRSFPSFLYQSLREKGKAWPLKPHSDVLDATFESDKLKALASFQDLYVGLEPYRNDRQLFGGVFRKTAPAVFGLLAAIELHPTNDKAGVYAPRGGFESVSNAMERLARDAGVDIRCGATVTKVTDGGVHVRTVDAAEDEGGGGGATKSEFVSADAVVVNADLPYATETILDEEVTSSDPTEARYDFDDSYDYSSGVVAFHWSTSKRYDDLNTHNVFLSARDRTDAEASWGVLRQDEGGGIGDAKEEDSPFNFYVHRAVKTDPTAAPEGCDSIMVLVPTETLRRDKECALLRREEAIGRYKQQFDEGRINNIRSAVLKRMGAISSLKDLKENILHEMVDTPGTWADDYNLAAGTPFALSHGFNQLSLTRPAPKAKRFENVWFVGASTKPGNGVPLVLLGAKQIANQLIKSIEV